MQVLIDYHSRSPIYEQIKEQIIKMISCGALKNGDQLPSLRQLSAEMSVNINTIKRAFSELEDQGFIYSVAGKGIFIGGNTQTKTYLNNSLDSVKSAILNAKALGAEKDDIVKLVEKIYTGDDSI